MKIKKILALMMVMLVTILSISVPASAASTNNILKDDTVSINVECSKKGYTFKLYQVAVLNSTTSTPYETKYTPKVSEIANSIKKGDTATALETLDGLSTIPSTATAYGTFDTDTESSHTFSSLPQGIYYIKAIEYPADVTSIRNSILALPYYTEDNGWVYSYDSINLAEKVVETPPTTHKEITNSTKNNVNFTDVSIGDTVNFKLTNTITGSKQIRLNKYTVYDVMSKGLTFDKSSLKVYLAGSNGAKIEDIATTDYNLVVTKEAAGSATEFNVALTSAYLAEDNFYNNGVASMVVEYSAKLNQYAVVGTAGNPNEDVKLEYGNRSKTSQVQGNTVYVYTYAVSVDKLNEDQQPLAGADFALYSTESDANSHRNEIATGTSNSNGKVLFYNADGNEIFLTSGTYYICETAAPEGYGLLGRVITITIDTEYQETFTNNTYVSKAPTNGYATVTVTNYPVPLPNTGGYVAYMYYIGGGLLAFGLMGIVVYAVVKKKRSKKAE